MNHIEVMWFGRDGGIIGHACLEEFQDFLKEKLEDARYDARIEHGMDAESA